MPSITGGPNVESVVEQDAGKDYRTRSISINRILRSDIDESTRKSSLLSSLISWREMALHLLMLKFCEGILTVENNIPVFREMQGFDISQVLPGNYIESEWCYVTHSALPLPSFFFDFEDLTKEFDLLFYESHLSLVHPSIYLSPGREAKRQQYMKPQDKGKGKERRTPLPSAPDLSTTTKTVSTTTKPFARNAFHNIKRGNSSRIKNYLKRKEWDPANTKWYKKIYHCNYMNRQMLQSYKTSKHNAKRSSVDDDQSEVTTVTNAIEEEEDEESKEEAATDLTKQRLRILKALYRNLILDDNITEYNEEHIKELLECVLHLDWDTISRVLPFCILANDVLAFTGYSKFQRKLFPDLKFSNKYLMSLNATALYHILDRNPNRYIMTSYDGSPLVSAIKANQNKNTVYSSIFDFSAIQQVCQSHSLTFAQHMAVEAFKKANYGKQITEKEKTWVLDVKNDVLFNEI
ncbi:hypothetical protein BDF21DRAFT_394099 [Thamnidium elegans]|nr:hypothetical protein BDF21DRAFT_394099 [Thamnidium elegans]